MRFIVLTLFLLGCTASIWAQEETEKDLPNMLQVNFNYGFQVPGGDLADRFGLSSSIGANVNYMAGKIIFGAEGAYIFGANVKTDVLAAMRTEDLAIIGDQREYTDVTISERGFYAGGMAGAIIPILPNAQRSGLRFTLGSGMFQHKIRIYDRSATVTQLLGDYKKGYDRLTNGLALKEFVGYHYFSKNQKVNFYFGFEFMQAFTKSRRDYNFDTMSKDDTSRVDMLYGISLGWTLPFFYDADEQFY